MVVTHLARPFFNNGDEGGYRSKWWYCTFEFSVFDGRIWGQGEIFFSFSFSCCVRGVWYRGKTRTVLNSVEQARWLSARPMVAALSSILVPIVSVLLGIFSVILTHLLNTRSSGFDTIQSWTCKFSTALPTTPMVLGETRGEMSNEKFGILCSESRFGLWGMVAVVILQVLMGGCAVGEWIVSRRRGVDSRRKEKGMEMGVIETDRKTEFSFQEE